MTVRSRNKTVKSPGSLRGYAFEVLQRDNFACRYCDLDGRKWPNWLYLSWDHLLPKDHPKRDAPEFVVATCTFCNTLHNRTEFPWHRLTTEEMLSQNMTCDEMVKQKRVKVRERRAEFEQFFDAHVRGGTSAARDPDPSGT